MMDSLKRIWAVIVTYNGKRWLDRCLGSLHASAGNISIIVIDNASTDGTPETISQDYPYVHLIRSEKNLGFAKANNIGIRQAIDNDADFVLLLNQDAWVNEDAIQTLVRGFAERNDAGIISPIHLNGNASALDWWFGGYMPSDFVSDAYHNRLQNYYETDFVNAAGWMISRECINTVGGFDTSLFTHYGEDSNYCQRVLYHGFKILIGTQCSICHDREFRKDNESGYRQSVFKQDDLQRRLEFGNILHDIDIDAFIDHCRVSRMKSLLKLNIKKAERFYADREFYKTIKASRNKNRTKGLNWL